MSYSQQDTEAMDSPDMSRYSSPAKKANYNKRFVYIQNNLICFRRSVADEAAMTQAYIRQNIDVLTELWDEVQMSEDNRYF